MSIENNHENIVRESSSSNINLLTPLPQERLDNWLAEFYGRPVNVIKRETLRHRDLSFVERLWIANSLPSSLIYKLVLPPWDIEQDIVERVLIPSVTNSAQLYLCAHHGDFTALFLEDLGTNSLLKAGSLQIASTLGEDLAKMHRAYIYRVDELMQTGILRTITPIDYFDLAQRLTEKLKKWNLLKSKEAKALLKIAQTLAINLASEPISLVHGDYYAENIIERNKRLFVIDWSWFTIIGVPLLDLATITAAHKKNGEFVHFKEQVIEAYCDESARAVADVVKLLPQAENLRRLLFLEWLVERKSRGIEGTTVGPVDNVILQVMQSLLEV